MNIPINRHPSPRANGQSTPPSTESLSSPTSRRSGRKRIQTWKVQENQENRPKKRMTTRDLEALVETAIQAPNTPQKPESIRQILADIYPSNSTSASPQKQSVATVKPSVDHYIDFAIMNDLFQKANGH